MAFPYSEMRTFIRFLVGDPNGNAVTSDQLRTEYVNTVYQEWYHRFERRDGTRAQFSNTLANQFEEIPLNNDGQIIEHMTIIDLAQSAEYGLRQSEYNRLRYLQESEGAIGQPESWAVTKKSDGITYGIWYPIPNGIYTAYYYRAPLTTGLTGDGSSMATDWVSAHMICRLAAYRLGVDMQLDSKRLQRIIAPVPGWVRMRFRMQWLFVQKHLREEESRLYIKELTRA